MLLHAYAKINLDLRILAKRSDGFHELRTVFQAIDWYDEIAIVPAAAFRFSATDGPGDETNLVVRAVRLFESLAKRTADVHIHLKKNIPSGAGLGGGSADAAATFLGLARLYGLELTTAPLSGLGADVAFFVHGGRALGTGRGDRIEPLTDETDYWLVLVNPGIFVSTAEAYSWLTVSDQTHTIKGFCAHLAADPEDAEPGNDFEEPVFVRHPSLLEIREQLLRCGAFRAAMSGSGSVMFGQFHEKWDAERAVSLFDNRYSVKLTKPLSRSEYLLGMLGK